MDALVNAISQESTFQRVSQHLRSQSPISVKTFYFEWLIVYYSTKKAWCQNPLPPDWNRAYEAALDEYVLVERDSDDDASYSCICSQRPLCDISYIKNVHNGNILMIGPECVPRFNYDLLIRKGGIPISRPIQRPAGYNSPVRTHAGETALSAPLLQQITQIRQAYNWKSILLFLLSILLIVYILVTMWGSRN